MSAKKPRRGGKDGQTLSNKNASSGLRLSGLWLLWTLHSGRFYAPLCKFRRWRRRQTVGHSKPMVEERRSWDNCISYSSYGSRTTASDYWSRQENGKILHYTWLLLRIAVLEVRNLALVKFLSRTKHIWNYLFRLLGKQRLLTRSRKAQVVRVLNQKISLDLESRQNYP